MAMHRSALRACSKLVSSVSGRIEGTLLIITLPVGRELAFRKALSKIDDSVPQFTSTSSIITLASYRSK